MRVVYLLEKPILCGGVKVANQHVDVLRRLGHDAWVVSTHPHPKWSEVRVSWRVSPTLTAADPVDLVVARYFTTVASALDADAVAVGHLC